MDIRSYFIYSPLGLLGKSSILCVSGSGEGDDPRREAAAAEGKETAEEETEGGKGGRTRNWFSCICSPKSRCRVPFIKGQGVELGERCVAEKRGKQDKVGLSKKRARTFR